MKQYLNFLKNQIPQREMIKGNAKFITWQKKKKKKEGENKISHL